MVKSLRPYILMFSVLAAMASCKDFSFSSYVKGNSIASVGDTELYMDDVKSIFTPGMSTEDSITRLTAYVDLWAKNQLKIQMAEERFSDNESDIEKMVNDYRNSLLIHKFEEDFVANNMDTTITSAEISTYYQGNKGEFILSSPLVKGIMVQVPVGFRQEARIRELARSGKEEMVNELVDIAVKNDLEYHEFQTWTPYLTAVSSMPLLTAKDYQQLQAEGGFVEATGNGFRYFMNVSSILKEGDYTPMDMVTGTIRIMIINKRKQDTIKTMEDSIYNDAVSRKLITIK